MSPIDVTDSQGLVLGATIIAIPASVIARVCSHFFVVGSMVDGQICEVGNAKARMMNSKMIVISH